MVTAESTGISPRLGKARQLLEAEGASSAPTCDTESGVRAMEMCVILDEG